MKILLILGSKSDNYIAEKILKNSSSLFDINYQTISAHRNPTELEKSLKETSYDYVIAGAGLAAHLPGVIASKTIKPVFGIPIKANFGAMDALLSIQQMPFGVPVITTPPNDDVLVLNFLKIINKQSFKKIDNVHIVINPELLNLEYVQKEKSRTESFAKERQLSISFGSKIVKNICNIVLVTDKKQIVPNFNKEDLILHVPLFNETEKTKFSTVITLYDWVNTGGLWLGVNNTRNAVLAYLKFFS